MTERATGSGLANCINEDACVPGGGRDNMQLCKPDPSLPLQLNQATKFVNQYTLEVIVKYSDGNEAKLGDVIAIDSRHRGTVVACIDRDEYSDAHPKAQWSYLGKGIVVETDFAGLVHYWDEKHEQMVLIRRGQ